MGNWEEEMAARIGGKGIGRGAEERDCRLCILQIRSGIFRSSGNAKFPLVSFSAGAIINHASQSIKSSRPSLRVWKVEYGLTRVIS